MDEPTEVIVSKFRFLDENQRKKLIQRIEDEPSLGKIVQLWSGFVHLVGESLEEILTAGRTKYCLTVEELSQAASFTVLSELYTEREVHARSCLYCQLRILLCSSESHVTDRTPKVLAPVLLHYRRVFLQANQERNREGSDGTVR